MKYNFDEIIDRRNTNAVKLERCKALFGTDDLLPLWVADMDFSTPDFVLNAIQQRLKHPILGYTTPPDNLFDVFIAWTKDHHQWELSKNQVGFVPGVVPALAFAVQCFTNLNDEIIVQPPVYYPFFSVIQKNGRKLIYNPLKEIDNKYEMDFEDLERKITPATKMLILCNPHNPAGRVWSLDTLKRLDELCAKHKILVVSDEIHADMALSGNKHIPYATVSETAASNSVTFMAPSKVFNMPGLVSSFYIIPNQFLKEKFAAYLEALSVYGGNIFAYHATVACYEKGNDWRIAMLDYVQENIDYVIHYLKEHMPQIKPMIPEASFLVWLDCEELGMEADELHQFFAHKAGLGLNKGASFGPGGEYFLRMNVACPRKILEKAMHQLKNALSA